MKYLGGKQRLGKHLSPILHAVWDYYQKGKEKPNGYLEPFCGSLGVFKPKTMVQVLFQNHLLHYILLTFQLRPKTYQLDYLG